MLTKTGEASMGTPAPSCWPLCIESELECAEEVGFREDKACRVYLLRSAFLAAAEELVYK